MANRTGRPPYQWTEDVENELMRRIMQGEAVYVMCGPDRDEFLPSETTFYSRLASDPDFAAKYARAKEALAHREAEEIRAIADMATSDSVNVARLQIDARKWRASKLAPKSYGDKQQVDMTHDLSDPMKELLDFVNENGKRLGDG